MGLADTARLAVQLDLKGNFAANLRANQKLLGQFDSTVARSQTRAQRAGQQIGTGIKNVAKLSVGLATAGAGIVAASLRVAGDFEAQLNTINTIARQTPAGLEKIGDSIRKISKDTGTGLEDLTQGYYDLLSAGVKAADASKVLTAANQLAIGGLSTTAESVDLLTTALNVYGGGAAAATKDADIFAKAIERGKVTAAELAQSFSQVGGIAKTSGISLEELGAAYARLTSAGVPAAEAATQVRSAIVALTKVSGPLEKLQKQTGRNYLSIAGKQGLVAALEIMRKDAAKAGVPLIDLLGRVEGLNFTLATTGSNFAAYNADLKAMGDAAGTAAGQMAERQKGLNFQLARLKALAKDAGITIGSALLPKITPLVARLTEFLNLSTTQGGIKDFGTAVAGLFNDDNIKAGIDALKTGFETAKTAAPVVAQAAKATLGFVQAAVSLFRSLPGPLQGLLVGGFALNKLTGGLVTNIAGGIIDTVGKSFLQRGGTPANPLFVSDVTGALGKGVGGALGGAGLLGIAKTLLTTVAIPAVVGLLIAGKLAGVGPFADSTPKNQIKGLNPAARRDPGNLDIRRLEAAENRTGNLISASGQILGKQVSATTYGFRQLTANLQRSRSGKDVAAALKAVMSKIFVEGKGGSGGATNVLNALKVQLKNTHDPALQRALRDAIGKVERKIVSRKIVEDQLKKADSIAKSSKSNVEKIKELKHVQQVIGNRNATATKRVQEKIDAAKRAQTRAQALTTKAVKDKKLAVAIKNVVNTTVQINAREVGSAIGNFVKYFKFP